MRAHVILLKLLPILLFTLLVGCAHPPRHAGDDVPVRAAEDPTRATGDAPPADGTAVSDAPNASDVSALVPRDLPAATSQLLVVVGEEGSSAARLYALERRPEGWRRFAGPLPAAVGRHGFAPKGEKREGDGKSPSGLFPLEFVFGYAASVPSAMPYRQATENDLWVDDPGSPDYNRWVRKGETSASSYEIMRLPDNRYRHGVVIGYNRDPVVPGKGSAIFLHAWLEEGHPTAGCVALDEEKLVSLIRWIDPAKGPMILMGNGPDLAAGKDGAP